MKLFIPIGVALTSLCLLDEIKVLNGLLIGNDQSLVLKRRQLSSWYSMNDNKNNNKRSALRSVHPSNNNENEEEECDDMIINRRNLVFNAVVTTTAAVLISSTTTTAANAFEKAYPVELGFVNDDTSWDLQAIRKDVILKKKANYKKSMDYVTKTNLLSFRDPKDLCTCILWGGALWLLSGSRSNPVITPVANLFYDENKEDWLKDRNDGLFASLPIPLYIVLLGVFVLLGILTDRLILFFAEGSANEALQLAIVALINGCFFELGRIANDEKGPTRDQFDRTSQLREEFNEFAEKRIQRGGNCHRRDVVRAFRRYFGQYRNDNEEYPLTDLEIEKLLREWNSVNTFAEMTPAGFYNGLSVDKEADAFA